MEQDFIRNFIFKDRSVRGSIVRLKKSYEMVVSQHHYPPVLGGILGEALLGACLLGPFFKNPGKITLQFQGEGDLKFLSTRLTSDFTIRGLIRAEHDLISEFNLLEALKVGQLSLTYEPLDGRPYQSFISIEQTSIAKTLEDYFIRSEQLPTRFFLARSEDVVAGMMLQVLPDAFKGNARQDFEHCTMLAATVKDEELLSLEPAELLHRLFAEEDLTLFEPRKIEFACNCSRERMAGVVINLGQEQANSILEDHGFVEVTCEFCGQAHQFNEAEVPVLFLQHSLSGAISHHSPGIHLNG